MNARPALLMIALSLGLAACGNKGPLVQAPVPVEDPATPAGAVPVEVEPQTTYPQAPPANVLRDPTAVDPLIDPLAEPAPEPALPIDPATVPDPGPPPTDDDGNG
ncbi:LPS translocon maturation chaperone LptM [Lysobacter sp. D1-1-M9]|uniref:LPS translocon maturation chaperone LptM n=1 Tax=Novilysobacter longmucuonensis TaxID=3098603 RepID=UPI002FC81754